ncbi:hypothetical protein OUO20_10570 [Arthrobacter sp. FX8]|uniref:hypothetical protein n=1 Tax=unclassified Arthrobacter TaxID=235627 RepID=UPI0011A1E812|nr:MULTISPECIES: hypothetical protein [unclassified Arthrobacter]TWD57215.1 hypothetical protein FB478_1011385 [Arthrobacter sp. AG367]WAJ35311.1 hypothetical protein OUO20_10570 [Arthrobacter sp. FX8]
MILVVAVALWIVWVAPYVLRNRRHQFQPAVDFLADAPADEGPDPHAGLVLNVAAQQEKAMEPRKSPAPGAGAASTPPPARLRIRYGRTALALVGLLSLVTAFISGILAAFGIGSPALPILCTVLTVGSVALLRMLAVRDRKAKVNAAFRSAMSAPARRPETADAIPPKPEAAPARPDSPLFDAEAGQAGIKRLTAVELREAALAVAVAAGDTSAAEAAPATPAGTPWEPVEVPKPVYVDAAKAKRPEPQPLELPEAPKAVGKPSLKQGAAGVQAAESAEAQQVADQQLTKAQSALSNLDDVLQRRRA